MLEDIYKTCVFKTFIHGKRELFMKAEGNIHRAYLKAEASSNDIAGRLILLLLKKKPLFDSAELLVVA